MSELLRHRHTVEQYGVRVEIPTEAHRVSHGSTRSMYTSSWPCFESNGFQFGRRYALSMPHTTARRNCQPPYGRNRRCIGHAVGGSLAGMHGCVPTWHTTGQRDVREPLVRPLRASPSHCPSRQPPVVRLRFIGPPAARSGSPPRLRRAR